MKIKISKRTIDRDEFIAELVKKHNCRQIGAGKFGSVFASPDEPHVIKVCRDLAYRSFLALALKYQQNPWFPRIESAVDYHPLNEAPYLVVVLERLRKGSDREIKGALCLFDNERFKDVTAMVQILGFADMEKMDHLSQVRRVLTKLYRKNYGRDFHEGNVMFRDSQAVITDPIVGTE